MGVEPVTSDGSVNRISHDDETDTTKVYEKPITFKEFNRNDNCGPIATESHQRTALENTIAYMSENLLRDHWSTMRYAVEEYAAKAEAQLKTLLLTSIEDRLPGHFEEVAFAGSLVQQANEVLMHFKQCRSDFGVDL
jgi:hypothetical protein